MQISLLTQSYICYDVYVSNIINANILIILYGRKSKMSTTETSIKNASETSIKNALSHEPLINNNDSNALSPRNDNKDEATKVIRAIRALVKHQNDVYRFTAGKKRNRYSSSTPGMVKVKPVSKPELHEQRVVPESSLNSAISIIPITAHQTNVTHTLLSSKITAFHADIRQTSTHTADIRAAQSRIRTETLARGVKYKNNTVPSRAGYMAENAIAETMNLDSVIKKSSVQAIVPDCNRTGSPDVIVTDSSGNKIKFSSKFYGTAAKSAKAQTDPRLDGQGKIVPTDQLAKGKTSLNNRAHREELRGRSEAAVQQRKTANDLTDRIKIDGVESTPLTKKNAHDLAKAISVDKNGDPIANMAKIDKVLDETGVTEKVNKAVEKNDTHTARRRDDIVRTRKARTRAEIKGAAFAAVTVAATAGLITATTELIQNGITTENVQAAANAGLRTGVDAGVTALGTYGLTRTVGVAVTNMATKALTNAGINISANMAAGLGIGIMGAVATAGVSAYTFIKMKSQGATMNEALVATGKNAASSMAIVAATGIATVALGATGGLVVSAAIGLGMMGYSLFKAFRNRRKEKSRNSFYTEWGNPSFAYSGV